MSKKRPFGTTRTLPSGRVQASYIGPDKKRHNAPFTFPNKPQAREFLAKTEAEIFLGIWSAQEVQSIVLGQEFGEYCERHIAIQTNRGGRPLEASTQAHYRRLLATHLSPFASLTIAQITTDLVADWWAEAAKSGHLSTLSKAYKLLSATMNRAVREGLIAINPCQVRGAQSAKTGKEVYVPTVEEVTEFLRHLNPDYRLLALIMANGGARFEEATALTRADFALTQRFGQPAFDISVQKAVAWANGKPYLKIPKSKAGVRIIRLSPELTDQISNHLETRVSKHSSALVFPAARGGSAGYMQHSVLNSNFKRAIKRASLPHHFSPHGLRHFFGSEYARTGANFAEIGEALGDSSLTAIQRYVHSTRREDELLANMRVVLAPVTD